MVGGVRRIGPGGDVEHPASQRGTELGVGLVALIDAAQVEVVTHRLILISVTEGGSGPAEDLLGGLHGAAEIVGDGGHAESVDVAQHQRRPIGRVEPRQHDRRHPGIDATESSTRRFCSAE